jgi:hypothetical protein
MLSSVLYYLYNHHNSLEVTCCSGTTYVISKNLECHGMYDVFGEQFSESELNIICGPISHVSVINKK